MSAEDLTRKGIAAHKAGDTPGAARLLSQAVQADPTYEMAWLWLASSLAAPGERRYCLERALTANPQSQPAQKGLATLGDVAPTVPAALAGSEPIEPPPELAGLAVGAPVKKRRLSPLAFGGLVIGGLVVLCVFLRVTGLGLAVLSGFAGPLEGQEAQIVTSASMALVAVDDAAYNTEMQAARTNNLKETERLMSEGRVFAVPSGTRVQVVEISADRTRVRILGGEHTGKIGLVPLSFVE